MTLLQEEIIMLPDSTANSIDSTISELALLAKLQEMVPDIPKGKELTNLEIINYVIDYIRRLKKLVD